MQAKLRPFGAAAVAAVLIAFTGVSYAQEKKAAPASASACKGLSQSACAAKGSECQWIVPKKGKQKPYCRKKTVPKKKTK
jgi:hypothetical protein